MNCSDIRPMLSAYYDGEATPEEYDLVERHLATCPDCRRVMAEYRAIGGGIRALPVPVAPAGLRRDVWRAIEAQHPVRGASTARPARPVTSTFREERKPTPLGPLANLGRGWGKVGPATALVAAMLLIFAVAFLIARPRPVGAASLEDPLPIKNYSQPLHVRFAKQVSWRDAQDYTYLQRLDGSRQDKLTNGKGITNSYDQNTHLLTITPTNPLEVGARYEIHVDASKISLGSNTQFLADDPIVLPFETQAYTPTPTHTATQTPTPTRTPTATPRIEPTQVAQNTNTPVVPPTAGRNTPTPTARPSNTPVPATATLTSTPTPTRTPTAAAATATRTAQPPATPTAKSTQTPPVTGTVTPTVTPTGTITVTLTPTPVHKNTPTPTPRTTATPHVSTTPTPPCSIIPVNGFGKLWREQASVRSKLGCPTAYEIAIQRAAEEHFQGGYMFWRGDTNTIYVFVGTNLGGSVYEYQDTWLEDDPTPVPGPTPPSGLYAPVRGFGKIWSTQPGLRQALGWATDQETGVTGAWQPFVSGSALWTSDRVIRLVYDDGTWESYPDTYVTPTPTGRTPPTNRP